ncbi:pectate lyase-domain-containing protein [Dactylonectria macrodidyma]|uniref:Pectate lyase n=1 Tax=Dactylonectria macrodidyma TaxID=307937 RepID=A0A9P9EYL6_9HYPO|nr:pectate lyase-domain-containing protein [Dactylonectria macrodidyma]
MRTAQLFALANAGAVALAAVDLFSQCGGSLYSGDTECPSDSTCTVINDWYSQCVPSADGGGVDSPAFGNGGQATATPSLSVGEEDEDEDEDDSDDNDATETDSSGDGDQTVVTSAAAISTPSTGGGSSGNDALPTGITRTLPASSGAVASATAITVSGTFDGEMFNYDRSPSVCQDQVETGEDDAMFILEDGATLKNVIIGPGQAEGVHCKGTCTLINVWWEDVCEDAITLKQESGTSQIIGGGAFHASDKIIQFNGRGTVEISNFYAEDYGKLGRSCGNCDGNGGPRNFVIDNVAAVDGGVLCGINTNYGDTCTITNSCQDSGKSCTLFTGNDTGDEPTKLSEGPDGEYCVADSFSETC